MDFALSEEQGLLAASLRRFLAAECPVTRVRELVAARPGHDGGVWKSLCELGVAGLLVPEAHGGSGLGMLDAAVAAESLAWGVAPGPFLGSAVMAPVALLAAGSAEQQARWLPRLATGSVASGWLRTSWSPRRDGAGVALRGGRLHGLALMVIDGIDADQLLVPVDGGRSLARIDAHSAGVATTVLKTISRTRGFAELKLDGARVEEWIGEPGAVGEACRRMLDAARVALAADILGASVGALELAVAYALQRKQFERVVGSFQAVKHLCAEMVASLSRRVRWSGTLPMRSMRCPARRRRGWRCTRRPISRRSVPSSFAPRPRSTAGSASPTSRTCTTGSSASGEPAPAGLAGGAARAGGAAPGLDWRSSLMKTKLAEELGLEFPIFAFTHCRDVAAAVSKAGGLGVLGVAGHSLRNLEMEMDWIEQQVGDKPYGVDLLLPTKFVGSDQGGISAAKLDALIPDEHRQWIDDLLERYGVPALPDEARGRGRAHSLRHAPRSIPRRW